MSGKADNGAGLLLRQACGLPFELVEIVAGSHGDSEQFFQCLVRCPEPDPDFAGAEFDAFGQIGELLIHHRHGRLDRHPRLLGPVLLQRGEDASDFLPAAELVLGGIARGQSTEMRDESLGRGDGAGAHTVGGAALEDLLGAAATDVEELFEIGAFEEGAGKSTSGLADRGQVTQPCWFGGHGSSDMLVRICAEYKPYNA